MRSRLPSPLLVLLFAACSPSPGRQQQSKPPAAVRPLSVATFIAATEQVARQLALTGTLKANAASDVAANASGQVLKTLVERGSVVRKGQPLVQLDARQSVLTASEATANLESMREQKALADAECERNRRLFERHVITQQELDKVLLTCKTQQLTLAATQAREQQAQLTVSDAWVRAPFDGVVSERFVNVGEYVRADTRVVHLVQSDPLRIELTAGESDAAAVQAGRRLGFQVKAFPDRSFSGTVRFVAPALRSATRDLVFEAVVPNPDGALKPGMFASARMEAGSAPQVVVPRSALREAGDTWRAFVVKDGRLEERLVQLSRELGERVVVARGLASGERVVQVAGDNLEDGAAVE